MNKPLYKTGVSLLLGVIIPLLTNGCRLRQPDSARSSSTSDQPQAPTIGLKTTVLPPSEVEVSAVGDSTGSILQTGSSSAGTSTGGETSQLTQSNSGSQLQTTGAGGGSQLQSQQVGTSQVEVIKQILSEFKAQQTDKGIIITLPENILFDFDKFDIRSTAKPALTKIDQLIKYYSKAPIAINGHTDSKGSDSYNQALSENRANSVKTYLINNFNVDSKRLETKGFGKTQPVAANANPDGSDNPEGRQKNRRVEVVIKTAG